MFPGEANGNLHDEEQEVKRQYRYVRHVPQRAYEYVALPLWS